MQTPPLLLLKWGFVIAATARTVLGADKWIFGSRGRYDIDITQFWIEGPIGANWSVALDIQNDYQTGASPWFVGTQQNGEPGVIMSGASIEDNRLEVGVYDALLLGRRECRLHSKHSDEDDYAATALAMDASWNTDDDSRTWSAIAQLIRGHPHSHSGCDTGLRRTRRARHTVSLFWRFANSVTYSDYESGAQLHLQRRISIPTPTSCSMRARRPMSGSRYHWVTASFLSLRMLHFRSITAITATAGAQTPIQLNWVGHKTFLVISLLPICVTTASDRADFYTVIADTNARYYADDYRLSSFGALTIGARWAVALGDQWTLQLEAGAL